MDSIRKLDMPPFEDGGPWKNPLVIGEGWRHYRVGACTGAYRATVAAYEILAISNDNPGNGHVEAALAWFYKSCKRDKKDLIIKTVLNKGLAGKLGKMGFTCLNKEDDYIKRF